MSVCEWVIVSLHAPPRLVHHCLATFGAPCSGAADLWALDEGKARAPPMRAPCPAGDAGAMVSARSTPQVCRHLGIELLRTQGAWPLAAFMQRWRAAAPEASLQRMPARPASYRLWIPPSILTPARLRQGLEPALDMLRGEALVDGDSVTRFSASELPAAAAQRFAALFAVRPLWEREALEPYIADLNSPGQSAEALLLDHARAVQSNTALLYGARHAGLALR